VAAVSNSSPLIYVSALADLALVRQLFGQLLIPEAVFREVVVNGEGQPGAKEVGEAAGDWIQIVRVEDTQRVASIQERIGLQAGESEAIVLTRQLQIGTILLDDRLAVLEAETQRLSVVRTPALYLAAKRAGLIERVEPKLDSLRSSGFYLRDEHYRAILQRAEEL